jgi:hypothetical protein
MNKGERNLDFNKQTLSDENLMNEICDGKKKMIALTRLATADSV